MLKISKITTKRIEYATKRRCTKNIKETNNTVPVQGPKGEKSTEKEGEIENLE